MLIKTNGIVLHSLKYTDSSTIVTIYTNQFGRTSYMVHGVNKKKSKFRAAFLQPLSVVELDVYHTPGKDIQNIKDIRVYYPFTGIPFHPVKNSLALFVSEVLFRALKQTEADENLYHFLENSVQVLDCCEEGLANFHLVFLMKLSRYLGFEPNGESAEDKHFDLMNGIFIKEKPLHTHFLLPEATANFLQIMQSDYLNMQTIKLTRDQRLKLVEILIEYYKLHIPDFHGLNSLPVLHALFD